MYVVAWVRGRGVGLQSCSEPPGDRDGPALTVLGVADPQRPRAGVHVGQPQVERLRDPQPSAIQHPEQGRVDQRLVREGGHLSLIHISEPTRRTPISYAVFCLKKKKKKKK